MAIISVLPSSINNNITGIKLLLGKIVFSSRSAISSTVWTKYIIFIL